MFNLNKNFFIIFYVSLIFLFYICIALNFYEIYLNKILFFDDSILLGKLYFNGTIPGLANRYLFIFYKAIIEIFGSINSPQIFLILNFILISTSIFFIINKSGFNKISSFLFALLIPLISLKNIDKSQIYFAAGAHPSIALSIFFLITIIFLYFKNKQRSMSFNFFFLFLSYIASWVILYISPIYILFPFATYFLNILFNSSGKKVDNLNLLFLVFFVYFIWLQISGHHYNFQIGWTSYNLQNVLKNLLHIIVSFFSAEVLFYSFISTLLVVLIENNTKYKISLRFIFWLIFVSLILLAPGLIVKNYANRYMFASFIILLIAIPLLIIYFKKQLLNLSFLNFKKSKIFTNLIISISLIFIFIVFFKLNIIYANISKSYISNFNLVKKYLTTKQFSYNDQVLIITNDNFNFGTQSFNHWSSWFVRAITNNPNLIALIGPKYLIVNNAIHVSKYKDHGQEFWAIKNGVSYRKKMFGLELDRKTHVLDIRNNSLNVSVFNNLTIYYESN